MPKWWNWYTRTTQNRVAQVMRVRLSPWAQNKLVQLFIITLTVVEVAMDTQLLKMKLDGIACASLDFLAVILVAILPEKLQRKIIKNNNK
jgi:hypothetical protein